MICLFGGTFDPVHNGHVHAARAAATRLSCPVRMVLSARPPHRPPPAAPVEDRWAMLRIACAGQPDLAADDLEIHRTDRSYTIDTLEFWRRRCPDGPIFWVVGVDAFRDIGTWHRWREVFDFAHLLLLERPGATLNERTGSIYERLRLNGVPSSPSGGILRVTVPMLDVSATAIRASVASGRRVTDLLPQGVPAYIKRHGLYAGDEATEHPNGAANDRGNE